MELEFATCAVNRPELLDITYSSLLKHLKGVNFDKSKLYIHIDKTPTNENINEVEKVARKYFKNTIVKYTDEEKMPRYSRSFKWVMEQPKGEYFFYIEDDWRFVKDFHINQFIKKINQTEDIKFVIINNNWTHIGPNVPKFSRRKEKFDINYKPKEVVCTTPSFYDNKFIQKHTNEINEVGFAAEPQLIDIARNNNVRAVWYSDINHYYCEDLGAPWKDQNEISGSDIDLFCYYNLCENCKKPVPKKIYFCEICRRRWCSQKCKDEQIEEHQKFCEIIPKNKRNGFMGV